MKFLVVYIDDPLSYIAIEDIDTKFKNVFSVENILLFKHPELFHLRLMELVRLNSNFTKLQFQSIIFSLGGSFDNFAKTIRRNDFLDYISYTNSYDGYDFKKYFSEYLTDERGVSIQLLSYYETFAKGVNLITSFEQPSLMILLDKSYETGFVFVSGDVKLVELEFDNERRRNENNTPLRLKSTKTSLSQFIGEETVFNIVQEKNNNISEEYSKKLSGIVENLIDIANSKNFRFRSITIITNKKFLIKKDLVKPNSVNCKINIIQPNYNIALIGCGIIPSQFLAKEKISEEELFELILV